MLIREKSLLQKANAVATEILSALEAAIASTDKKISDLKDQFPDPGERYKAVIVAEEQIQALKQEIDSKINQQAGLLPKIGKTGTAVGMPAAVLGFGGIMTTVFVVGDAALTGGIVTLMISGMSLLMGGGLISLFGDEKEKNTNKAYKQNFNGLYHSMEALLQKTIDLRADILKNEFDALGASPHFDDLYDRVPAIKDAFVKAATRERYAAQPKLEKPLPKPRPDV